MPQDFATRATGAPHQTIAALITAHARHRPDAPAILAPGREPLTYRGLAAQMAAVVAALNARAIGRDDRVAIVVPNGPDMAVAFLAVAAGATSAPLNPAYRAAEFDFYLEDLAAKALLIPAGFDSPARAVAAERGIPVIEMTPAPAAGVFSLAGGGDGAAPVWAEPGDTALVLHTSGTTSRPKMVPLTQANICASAGNIVRTLALDPADRCLNVMPLFHIHGLMAATLASLRAGGSIVCTPGFAADAFYDWLAAFQPTWYTAVPTIHQQVLAGAAANRETIAQYPLRFIRSSSASLPPPVMAELEAHFNAPVVEAYGMTEASHQMTSNPLPPGQRKPGSVGQPAGPEVAIMAESAATLLPPGATGEIVIRGVNVTAGYAANPEANAKAFAAGWFRTGDQGYFDDDGYLFISGRLKEIINRGGEKIAPREVDECLLAHPAVAQAVTFARPHPTLGEDVAAAVVVRPGGAVAESDLRAFAAARLADFKVPARIVFVDAIPKGPSGKLQRLGLAEQLADRLAVAYVEPETETERAVAAIFAATLARAPIGRHDNFFNLGGDSLSAAQIIGQIEAQFSLSLPLTTLLAAPTVAELAAAIATARQQGAAFANPLRLEPERRFEPFALTGTQQAYWVGRAEVYQGGQTAHHNYLEIEGVGLAAPALARAWRQLIARHNMLRAIVLPDGRQQVLATLPHYDIPVTDLRERDAAAIAAYLDAVRAELSQQVLPSDRWPLFDIRITLLPGDRLRLHISLDGLIADAWSRGLLLREWGHFYEATALPPALAVTFRDYVNALERRQQSAEYDRDRAYWQARLADFPAAPDLPGRGQVPAGADHHFRRRQQTIAPQMWQKLKSRGQQAGLSPAALLLTIYSDILAVWSREQHFVINVARFDRRQWHPQIEDIVGQMGSFTLLEVRYQNDETFAERARRIQTQLWQDIAHSAFDGVAQLRQLGQDRAQIGVAAMPIVFTMYAQDRRDRPEGHFAGLLERGELIFEANQTPQVWLDFHVQEKGDALQCDWDYVAARFPPGLMAVMFDAVLDRVRRLAADAGGWQETWADSARRIVPAAQLAARAAVGEAETMPLPAGQLQDGFWQQAARQPDRPAVITPARTLSYGELAALANRWGRHLRQSGARPNALVAVVMEKGWEQVVAALGVLGAGAAYLPIDPEVPPERLAFLLQDGAVKLVLTQSWLAARLTWPAGVQLLAMDTEPLAAVDDAPLAPVAQTTDLAVVIYTSGSTGQPKGVMLAHQGLVNAVAYTNRRFAVGPGDAVLALTALHHDMSIFDIFGPLAGGGTIVMPAAADRRDPAAWQALIARHRVTIWNSVPAMMEMLLLYAEAHPPAGRLPLRLAFLGGDWIPLSLPRRLRQISEAQVISVGGPTETSLWNIMFAVDEVDPAWTSIPYGRPIANCRYYILNEALADCPEWVAGEMYVAGAGVAQGYWGDEAQSRAKFPRHPQTGERLCRTGDMGRYRPDGTIEFLGRRDFQVKINGQRIELGEIEAALARHPAVERAVVLAAGEARGKKHLVACVVPKDEAVTAASLAAYLETKLPEPLRPGRFLLLPALPLTANGKVDRRALAEQADGVPATPARDHDETDLDGQIAALIAPILGLDHVDIQANLVGLGADSIDMIRIGNMLESQFSARPRMDQLFRLTRVAALADFVRQQRSELAGPAAVAGSLLAGFKPLLTPAERAAFKASERAIRPAAPDEPALPLPRLALDEARRQRYLRRRSVRRFSLKPIAQAQFGAFLQCLSPIEVDGAAKYRWASPGGLYPLQIYVHLKPGRVAGLAGGLYYYQPWEHSLVQIAANAAIDRGIHADFINAPLFDEAAFSLFLIAEFAAIAPAYGERSPHLVTLEAGNLAHLLECEAPDYGLGLCQIGAIDFAQIRALFKLSETQQLIHSLLGGGLESGDGDGATADEASLSDEARLLERITALSDEEARQMLEAYRQAGHE